MRFAKAFLIAKPPLPLGSFRIKSTLCKSLDSTTRGICQTSLSHHASIMFSMRFSILKLSLRGRRESETVLIISFAKRRSGVGIKLQVNHARNKNSNSNSNSTNNNNSDNKLLGRRCPQTKMAKPIGIPSAFLTNALPLVSQPVGVTTRRLAAAEVAFQLCPSSTALRVAAATVVVARTVVAAVALVVVTASLC